MARETVQSVERAFCIIELMAKHGAMGVREIAHASGLNTTVVHRLLITLVELGYADKQSENDKYILTYKMLAVGSGVERHNGVVKLAHPYLVQLSEECKETVHLVERAGTNIRYIDKVTSSASMFATGSYIGLEFQLASTAVGKAILAELPEREVINIWNESDKVQYTPNTICDLDTLLSELRDTRQTGFAYDNEERELGLFCIGVSILDYHGKASYGVSISAPMVRMQPGRLKEVEQKLRLTKEKIAAAVGTIF